MTTSTDIANMALRNIANSNEIANLDTDTSKQAKACRAFYQISLLHLLRRRHWRFARKVAELVIVDPNPDSHYEYAYRYPADCIEFRNVRSSERVMNETTLIAHDIIPDADGRLVVTDEPDACGEYTYMVSNPDHWPPDFILALSFHLSTLLAPSLTSGDPFQMGKQAAMLYQYYFGEAAAADGGEAVPDEPTGSSIERAR